jgi:predicted nucleic acid-binding protein
MPRAETKQLLIMDACVLIDFIKADRNIFKLFARYVGEIHLTSTMVREIKEVDNVEELVALGIVIVEPEISDAYEAANLAGQTSFHDRLCMLTAKRHGLTCVTNDTNLRRLCEREKVQYIWGLRILAELCLYGGIAAGRAIEIAEQIHRDNPFHITVKIIDGFKDIIKNKTV